MPNLREAISEFRSIRPGQNRKAYEKVLLRTSSGEIVLGAQRTSGRSYWARMVREGHLLPWNVIWAWETHQGERAWLALSLDTGQGKERFFDLTTKEGRSGAKQTEGDFGRYLERRQGELPFSSEDPYEEGYFPVPYGHYPRILLG